MSCMLQEREVLRLGGLVPIPVDLRVIAATHQPLRDLTRERRSREDLFYRINVLQLTLPPLRERIETSCRWPSVSLHAVSSVSNATWTRNGCSRRSSAN